jgi:hypothetical protein
LGWHQYWIINVTDGSVSVWCGFCRKKREPTTKELASHPHANFTEEQQAEVNAKVEAMYQWLEENGHMDVRTDPSD